MGLSSTILAETIFDDPKSHQISYEIGKSATQCGG